MNEQQNEKDMAIAKLALSLSSNETQGKQPSTEELAALHNGNLDSGRRQEVLSHIANTPSIYRQWIALVGCHQASVEKHLHSPAKSLFTSAYHWLSTLCDGLKPRALLSGTAIASLLFITVTLQAPQYTVDQLYQDHNRHWSPNLLVENNGLDPRSAQLFGRYKTSITQAFHHGLSQGLGSLDKRLFIDGISNKPPLLPANNAIPNDEYEHLLVIARVMAIAHFKCQQSSDDTFYQQANHIVTHSLQNLHNSDHQGVQALVKQLSFSQSPQQNICEGQKQVIELAKF